MLAVVGAIVIICCVTQFIIQTVAGLILLKAYVDHQL